MEVQRGSEWKGKSPGGGRVPRVLGPMGLGPMALGPEGLGPDPEPLMPGPKEPGPQRAPMGPRGPTSSVHLNNQARGLGPGHVLSYLILLNRILS